MLTFGRIMLTGCRSFVRNSWLTIAATAVMVVSITILLVAIVLNVTTQNAITEVSRNLRIAVYLQDSAVDEDWQPLREELNQNEYVSSIHYVSKQEAQMRFSESFGDDQGIVEGLEIVGGDSLPASLEISVSDLNQIEAVGAIASDQKYDPVVESVSLGKTDAKKTIERASSVRNFVVKASIVTAGVFASVAILIIFNTIRIAIFTRSEEIRIMKLIGATPGFIRGPFLVEASIYGVIAGLTATGTVYAMIVALGSRVATQPEFTATYDFFTQGLIVSYMAVGSIVGGVFIGFVSALLAMERYLKLKNW